MTDIYRISPNFDETSTETISKALKLSHLPEGVSAVRWNESENTQKPFVVIVYSKQWKDEKEAFRNGALNYVTFSVNPDQLAKKLDV